MGRRSTADGGRPRRALARGAAWSATERPFAVPAPALALSCSAQPLALSEDDPRHTTRHGPEIPRDRTRYRLLDLQGEDVGTVSVAAEGTPLLAAEGAGLALAGQSLEWRVDVTLDRPALRLTLRIHGVDLVLPDGTSTGRGDTVTVAVAGGSASIIGESVPTAARAAAGEGRGPWPAIQLTLTGAVTAFSLQGPPAPAPVSSGRPIRVTALEACF